MDYRLVILAIIFLIIGIIGRYFYFKPKKEVTTKEEKELFSSIDKLIEEN